MLDGDFVDDVGAEVRPRAAVACLRAEILTLAEIERYESLPHAASVVEPCQVCYLEVGHEGPHYSNVQDSRRELSWLRWSDDRQIREFVIAEGCAALDGDPADLDTVVCLLVADHPGVHSFEM